MTAPSPLAPSPHAPSPHAPSPHAPAPVAPDADARDADAPASRTPTADAPLTRAQDVVLQLCAARGAERSICPTEAARALAGEASEDWRRHLPEVRAAAVALARAGRLEILRKGRPIPPDEMRGVIRLRQPKT